MEEKLLKLVRKAQSYEYPSGVSFSEEADNYGFSWTPSIDTLISRQLQDLDQMSTNSSINHEKRKGKEEDYLSILRNDPVFHNPGSHQLMSESYGLDPYFSFQNGSSQLSWNYKSIQQERNHHISNQFTIDGIDLCRKGNYREALSVLKQATELNATNVDALVALGACNANIGHLTDAISQLQTALSLNPNDPNALQYLHKTKTQLKLRNIAHSQQITPPRDESDHFRVESGEEIEDKQKKSPNEKKKKRKSSERVESPEVVRKSRKKEKKQKKEKKRSSKSRSPPSSRSSPQKNSPVQTLHPILSRTKNSFWG
jgi:tetratricopeptide (TPR) repeat protein